MREGRDLRNKVVFCDGYAYAIGGLNCKWEKLNIDQKKWIPIDDYVINDNLDSWSWALMFTPSNTFSAEDMVIQEDVLALDGQEKYNEEVDLILENSSNEEISEFSEEHSEY